MTTATSIVLFAVAALGLAALALQLAVLCRHLRAPQPPVCSAPPISILKPLCGMDDDLALSLELFAHLDYPCYEVLLGLRDARDPACAVARAAATRWPHRMRVVVQRGEPGLNPKVNQLVTLAAEARHDILVVSDSNVRVERGYLSEIAAHLQDPEVGLVTHAVVGAGERRLGSLFDNLHLAGSIAPGVVAAQRVARHDVVVGKSMAFRRDDLRRLGGFESVKDVLAEDYVMGQMISSVLGKRVVIAATPIENVSRRRGVREFCSRYGRWSVLQRRCVGPWIYAAQVLLNPVFVASVALALSPGLAAAAAFGAVGAAKIALDGACARRLRWGGFRLPALALIPAKDLLFGVIWCYAFVQDRVSWRGNRLRVLDGTRLERPDGEAQVTLAQSRAGVVDVA